MIAFVFLFLSILFIRVDLGLSTYANWPAAYQNGFMTGMAQDLSLVLLLSALTLFTEIVLRTRIFRIVFFLIGIFIFLANLANVIYVKYFGSMLDFWVVLDHLKDLVFLKKTALSLSISYFLVISIVVFLLMIFSFFFVKKNEPSLFSRIFLCSIFLGSAIYLEQLQHHEPRPWQRAIGWNHQGLRKFQINPLSEQVIYRWTLRKGLKRDYESIVSGYDEASRVMQAYKITALNQKLMSFEEYDKVGHLDEKISFTEKDLWSINKILGLNPSIKPNILMIFGETLRALEFFHPEIGPYVFPELNAHLRKKGILLSRTYSSSLAAGNTVRALYSSLCSQFPNMSGRAPIAGEARLHTTCITDLLRDNGYMNFSFLPFSKGFHNQDVFDNEHGVQKIFGEEDYRESPLSRFEWGVEDGQFFKIVMDRLTQFSNEKPRKPFFAHLINVGTHHPWGPEEPEAKLAEITKNKFRDSGDYLKFLARLRYFDHVLSALLKRIESEPLLANTVVIFSGDHGLAIKTPFQQSKSQFEESQFRVLSFIWSPKMRDAKSVTNSIHQIDFAPTIAAIAGLQGRAPFVGKSILPSMTGSPWIHQLSDRNGFHYLFKEMSCFSFINSETECWNNSEDLLFAEKPKKIQENKTMRWLADRVRQSDTILFEKSLIKKDNNNK